jgi:anti-sigma-K factor RskA
MIPEEQQEQAALYALGLLPADEAAAFEAAMRTDAALASLARDLRETAGHLVPALPQATPSSALKARVLALVAAEARATAAATEPAAQKLVLFRPGAWVPWAIAAALAIFCGVLASERSDLRRQLAAVRSADPLSQVAVYNLDPAGDPKAASVSVAWVPGHQSGLLDVNGLPDPGHGKDYQLWAVAAGSKEPISAGVVKIDAKGHAVIAFKPDVRASDVKAFAISVEPAGGSPKKTGPIVFVGKQ